MSHNISQQLLTSSKRLIISYIKLIPHTKKNLFFDPTLKDIFFFLEMFSIIWT